MNPNGRGTRRGRRLGVAINRRKGIPMLKAGIDQDALIAALKYFAEALGLNQGHGRTVVRIFAPSDNSQLSQG